MPDDGPGLFTIGHSNQALDHFLSLLQRHGIEAVADVRTVPWSRYVPHFNATTLGAALASQGIDYVPLGRELGGRPAGDEFYDEQGHVLYGRLAASPAFQDGLDRVLARARTSRIALLCAEEDPARCHRHLLIGPVLRQRGVPVSHIRRDGHTETEADLAASDPPPTLFDGGSRNSGSADSSSGDDGPVRPWRSPRPVSRRKPHPDSPAR
ncbi:MAG TPA: DUF488 domain-containing protein [Streptosporangiaceae bacterium]